MRKGRMGCRATVLAAAMIVALPSASWSDPLLEAAGGDWTGNGSLRISLDGQLEPARCRVTNSYAASSSQLALNGRCAVPGQTWTIEGTLVADPSGGTYSGQWRNPRNDGRVALTGQRDGSQLTFSFSGDDPDTGERLTGFLVWTFREDQFTLQSFVETSERRVALGDLVFDR